MPTNAVTLREPAYCKESESSTPAKSPSYDWSLIAPYTNLFSLIANHYREWNDSFAWEDLGQIPADHGIHFYERRLEKIDTMLESDYTYGNYSEAEKEMYISYPLGKIVISYLGMVLFSYILLSLLCILCTGRFFRKHQVGR